MGLDMNLSAHKYLSGYSFVDAAEREAFEKITDLLGVKADSHSPYLTADVSIAYWRKANAIHGWFVENCQNGVDDCRSAYVKREQLEELRDLCGEVIEEPGQAEELLPVAEGFFFGDNTYGESYFSDIRDTYDMLTRILKDETLKDVDFRYSSSW